VGNKVPGGVVNQLLRDLWREARWTTGGGLAEQPIFFFGYLVAISFPIEFMFGADYVHISRLPKS
jgi:hypothetical protein